LHRNVPTGSVLAAVASGAVLLGAAPAQAADRTPPSVRWTSPGATVAVVAAKKKKAPRCQVSAKDRAGIGKVDFYFGPKTKSKNKKWRWIGRTKKAPFRCKWSPAKSKPGAYTLYAKATDKAGNEGWAEADIVVRATNTSKPADSPSPAPPAPSSNGRASIGISAVLRGLWGDELDATIAKMRNANVEYSREDFAWSRVEKSPGNYDWEAYDNLVGAAARGGLKLIAIPDDPPDWATGAWNNPPTSGEALQGFTEFVRRATERYGSNGQFWAENPDIPKVPVTMWDIWNEPYMKASWKNEDPEPAAYARMFKSVVSSVRGVDPEARFMLEAETGSATGDWPEPPFLGAMFEAVPDLENYADMVSVHPYTSEESPTNCSATGGNARTSWGPSRFQFCRVRDIRRILDSYGADRTRIWITEVGYTTAPNADRTVSEAQQASYLRAAFKLLRQWRVVDGVVWYELRSRESDPSDPYGYFGLLHENGSPKPAWNAFVDEAAQGIPAAAS
jgi:Bacterial Ig domain/Beta-galactosidase